MLKQSDVDSLASRLLRDAEADGLREVEIQSRLPRRLGWVTGLDTQVLRAVQRQSRGHVDGGSFGPQGTFIRLRARSRPPLPRASVFRAALATYQNLGIVKAREILLEPAAARRMIDDVEKLGIAVLGINFWHYGEQGNEATLEEVGIGFSLTYSVLDGPDVVTRSAGAARAYIASELPAETELVSLVLDVPPDWYIAALDL